MRSVALLSILCILSQVDKASSFGIMTGYTLEIRSAKRTATDAMA